MVVEATFVNPYSASTASWDYGFILRSQPRRTLPAICCFGQSELGGVEGSGCPLRPTGLGNGQWTSNRGRGEKPPDGRCHRGEGLVLCQRRLRSGGWFAGYDSCRRRGSYHWGVHWRRSCRGSYQIRELHRPSTDQAVRSRGREIYTDEGKLGTSLEWSLDRDLIIEAEFVNPEEPIGTMVLLYATRNLTTLN